MWQRWLLVQVAEVRRRGRQGLGATRSGVGGFGFAPGSLVALLPSSGRGGGGVSSTRADLAGVVVELL